MRLADAYQAFLIDLDGVLFRGDQPIDAAAPTVEALRSSGRPVVFLTNNSARTAEQVAEKLRGLGIEASAEEVVTSGEATADFLRLQADDAARTAFVIGQDGVRSALADAGFQVVDGEAGEAAFVVVGWDGGVTYDALRRASVLVRGGSRLVATNADASYPAPGGELWPGAGAILAAVETASGARATVVGKPHRPLFEMALARAGTREALVVGDRIETDIAGAFSAGLDAALVLSGASRPADLLDQDALPVAILPDVGGLLSECEPVRPRPADRDEMGSVRALSSPADRADPASQRDAEGVWVVADATMDATATVDVRGADAYLRAVATREEVRGRGLGTLIVAAALGSARARGAEAAWLLTETAEAFFRGLGFETVDRASMPRWIEEGPAEGCARTAVAMKRGLVQ